MEIPLSNKKLAPRFKRKLEQSEADERQIPQIQNVELTEEEKARKKRKEDLERLLKEEESRENIQRNDLPESIRNLSNEQIILSYIDLRKRNFLDGSLQLNIENNDLIGDNNELFQYKCCNIYPEKIEEGFDYKKKYFAESISQNKYYQLSNEVEYNGIADKETSLDSLSKEGEQLTDIKKHKDEKLNAFELEFEVNNSLLKISNNISIVFLFAQGLLAGIALANLIYFYSFSGGFKTFIQIYSTSAEVFFNITHFLTFGSLVGNGSKLVTIHRFYEVFKKVYSSSSNKIPSLKRKIVILHIIFWLLLVAFILELVIAKYIPQLSYSYYASSNTFLINETEFNSFKNIYLVIDIIVLLNFLINVGDVSRVNDIEYDIKE